MLEGRNIILRLLTEDDLEEFAAAYAKIADRGEFFPTTLHPLAEVRKRFAEAGWWDDEQGHMLITAKDGRMLGHIFYFKSDPFRKVYEIGYNIFRPADRGQGSISEALRIFAAYLFEIKPVARLQVLVAVGNTASRRAAEKCGFRHEGVLRQYIFMRGKYHDCDALSLLRSECPGLAETLQS
jgi:ribosomal-protein-alanine N-acetyltransferase